MKAKMILFPILPALVLMFGQDGLAADWFSSETIAQSRSPELSRAYAFALKGNPRAATEELKNALMKSPQDPEVLANVLDLLKRVSAEAPHGIIPVNWSLPEEVAQLDVRQAHWRSYSGNIHYDLRMTAAANPGHKIEQLQLIKYPDEIIYDLKNKIGAWERQTDKDGYDTVSSWHHNGSGQPAPDGLYLLNVKVVGGQEVQGWVILSEMGATELPEMLSPAMGEAFQTDTPTFSWKNYKSSLYQPDQRRSLSLTVMDEKDDGSHPIYRKRERNPVIEQITSEKLARGKKYRVHLNFNEVRRFGPVELNRQSGLTRDFSIAP